MTRNAIAKTITATITQAITQAITRAGLCIVLLAGAVNADAQSNPAPSVFDSQLAQQVGADEHGMRHYVVVILKTGPNHMPAGPKREEMFKGHFANIHRLADAGKLALAGPFDENDAWEGMFLFAVTDIDEARKLVATDPVIINGEMVAEYHPFYASASLMLIPDLHKKVAAKPF